MKSTVLTLTLCVLCMVGCSGLSDIGSKSSGPKNVVVSGQWDAITTPTNIANYVPINYYANVTDQGGGSFFAASGSVASCGNDDCFPGNITAPGGYSLNGTVNGTQVSIVINGEDGYTATLTGTVSADGTSMNGTYTDNSTNGPGPGTWAALKKQSVTGNYSGTYNSNLHPSLIPFNVSASITQAQDYSITGSATVTNSSCFTTLTFGQGSHAIGGAFSLVDSTNAISIVVIPNENGTLNSNGAFYSAYQITSGTCSPDDGTGSPTKQ